MKKGATTPKMMRQRKLMLVLPLIVLPFVTLLFWALGGGKREPAEAKKGIETGFNSRLPGASLEEDKMGDKMSYYDQAKLDSLKFQRLVNHDPNYTRTALSEGVENSDGAVTGDYNGEGKTFSDAPFYQGGEDAEGQTQKIYRKLAELDKELAGQPIDSKIAGSRDTHTGVSKPTAAVQTADVDRLEQMMQLMHQSGGQDPELQQLDGMLEKILDIQHPQRVQEKLEQNTAVKKRTSFSVSRHGNDPFASLLVETSESVQPNRFYSLDETAITDAAKNVVQAVIAETQTIVNNATVKLRLNEAIYINGTLLPKGHLLVGTASLNKERLHIQIHTIRHNNTLFPVELQVYDMDGLEGIHIPGAITRDVARQTADRSLQTLGMTSLDPSWGAQAAGAGIEAAKTLLSKKARQVKVTLKEGYRVLLKDNTQRGRLSHLTYEP